MTAVLVNTSGGVTGGDRFDVAARAGCDASLTLTTQTAERFYRARPGENARLRTHLTAASRSRLSWIPQETIVFDGADVERTLEVDLAPDAELLLVESVVFGRRAMGETTLGGRVSDRIEIRRGGVPLLIDAWRLDGAMTQALGETAVAGGAGAIATVVRVAKRAAGEIDAVRALLPVSGGASLRAPDLMVARILARDGYLLRKSLVPVLERLCENALPVCWRL